MSRQSRLALAWGGWSVAAVLSVPLLVWATTPGPAQTLSVAGTSAIDECDGAELRVRLSDIHSVNDLGDALEGLLGRPVHIHSDQIHWATQTYAEFRVPETDVRTAFRLFNAQLGDPYREVSWCVFGDHIEIGRRSEMEMLRRVRRTYEVGPTLDGIASAMSSSYGCPERQEVIKRVIDILQATVEPSWWLDNGGELASVQVAGTSLIITAPVGMQREIEDVLRSARKAGATGWAARGRLTAVPPTVMGGGQSPLFSVR